MASQVLELHAPEGGLHRGVGYQQADPLFCDDALNYWPVDVFSNRRRPGSRPGLVKAFPSATAGPTHLLANVRVVEGTASATQTSYSEDFFALGGNQPIGPPLRDATWKTPGAILKQAGYAFITSDVGSQPDGGLVLDDLNQSTSIVYSVKINILHDVLPSGFDLGFIRGIYSIFARMDNTNPSVIQNGVLVEADFTVSSPILSMVMYTNGSPGTVSTVVMLPVNATSHIWFLSLSVTGDSCVVTSTGGEITQSYMNGNFGRRMGFGIRGSATPITSKLHRVADFSVSYTGSASSTNRNVIVAAGGTNAGSGSVIDLRYEETPGTLVVPGTNALTNLKARQLIATELLGKLYIVGENTTAAPDPAVTQSVWVFDPVGVTPTFIAALTQLTADDSPTPGTVPSDGFTIAAWRNRLCVVTRDDQQNISMSKAGDPRKWAYTSLPVGSPVKLNTTGIDTGRVGEPINCIIAHSDDYLLVGCFNSFYVLRGDPTYGGQIDRLSSSIGIVAPQAYARGPNGETVFLSTDGLYAIPAGVLSYPESVSREKLPKELRDIDVNNFRVLMAYDVRNRGVFIGLTPMMGSGGTYFWMDWETRGFWPMEFNSAYEPTALVFRQADSPMDQRLLFGCRDGHIRAFNDAAFTDDGISFPHRLLIGPIALGGGGYFDGMILEYVGQLAAMSGDMTAELLIGNCIESARNATPQFPMPLRAGKNLTYRPRLRGNACYIKLSSPGGTATALESHSMVRQKLGKQRL